MKLQGRGEQDASAPGSAAPGASAGRKSGTVAGPIATGHGAPNARTFMGASKIHGRGAYVPEQVLPSSAIERRAKMPPGTIEHGLGVRTRHVAGAAQATSDLAVEAARRALADAGNPNIDLVLLATSTPDHPVPATAPQVATRLGLQCPAFDLMNTCAGWMYGLAVADRWPGVTLLVASNVLTRRLDWNNWSTAGLFGDGAGAVVLGPNGSERKEASNGTAAAVPRNANPQPFLPRDPKDQCGQIVAIDLGSDGDGWQQIMVPAGGSREPINAEGVDARRHLLRIAPEPGMEDASVSARVGAGRRVMDVAGWQPDEVRFIPHQANKRLVSRVVEELGVTDASEHLARYGNMSAASIPVSLAEAHFNPGDKVVAAVVAAGSSFGAVAIQW